ncbi:hypothetical protein Goarm_022832 [Gossypium armourianum]|uniref:Ribosomal protein S11 n=1 Tax=Gossypium armourianum TaxID=34283 RepID=A0A7J9KHZ3_9ROSI|nr:hypothetical protein [Gossypium armourianum]
MLEPPLSCQLSITRKSARRIPTGVIHVQASFNNTIVTVTDVWGWVISWSSAGTCGFKGTRKGTPLAAQTTMGNAIRAVVDQCMQRAEVMIRVLVSEEMQHYELFVEVVYY